ncbi:MAG: DUF1592 domain-containing protein [Deltaproteobacteria bacterium]|nr:DUF1592 domain-containing protein [Deltaproteobacteria bacterium]
MVCANDAIARQRFALVRGRRDPYLNNMEHSTRVLVALLVFNAACVGRIAEPPLTQVESDARPETDASQADGSPPAVVQPFACDPQSAPQEVPLRRLGRSQYVNSLDDTLASVDAALAREILTQINPILARFPADHLGASVDDKHGGTSRADQIVQQQHIDVGYDVATEVGQALTRDAARITRVFGACATDGNASNDRACLDGFLDGFGARALRRPLTAEDKTFYRDAVGGRVAREDLADLVALLLTAPQFMYHVEHASDVVGPRAGAFALDSWELASRLSYHFWQRPPDDALRAAAQSGALATEAGFAREVSRVFADPKTEAALDLFFREYLWLDSLPALDSRIGDPVFDAFRGDLRPTSALRDAMIQDVLSAAKWTVRNDQPLGALFTNRRSFAREPLLAGIYGSPMWDGTSEPPMFAQAERTGMLARAALLSTGTANTRPILKGVFIRIGLLCDRIPAPPNNAAATPIPMLERRTTRQVVEALTEADGTPCASCHQTLINPLGFASENFDSLGRVRSVQRFFDERGTVVGEAMVDTRTMPQVQGSDRQTSEGLGDLQRMLVGSRRLEACFARQYFRFTFGRLEATNGIDDCALQRLNNAALEGRPLGEVLRTVALDPHFRTRSFQ